MLIVFISDLHLHPEQDEITQRFYQFVDWAMAHAHSIYILGDLFHAWAGDDCMDAFSHAIAQQFKKLSDGGIALYFMPGNRDFLMGAAFARLAGWTLLPDPYLVSFEQETCLLSHGDRYCLADKSHQRFRRLTRNVWFKRIFLWLPKTWRQKLVAGVRQKSQKMHQKRQTYVDVMPPAIIQELDRHGTDTMIHGHTHRPGMNTYTKADKLYFQYILSDWDDNPKLMCYDRSKGFNFILTERVFK